ncbi:MAG: 5-amino-6-(D-ribitylamino)uracil--L-tyrosine 4-hydroxyphenyl transferase CofH [Candidatus Nanopelagicales bacterium]|nr:5-amino-6-(D-ribitylamino)uracil--L-tyrosine 4-hydroxyphenyl transferase CofH [Candidatus Nanopelagicales bacterium]MCF8539778.1 5-amino-6-(D-ribitylamino)uracil--L-tyrosine 4-hydroxyphenyl transferase CofH [Candidatus Nanopelagicales bacterium]
MGLIMTYSPKVFIPLTSLCRDRCGYCTFAKAPHRVPEPYLSIDQVVEVARQGAQAGCHEALFTMGEYPEDRYPQARQWLDDHGYATTIDYLVDAAQAVLDNTGLLPHANAGALSKEDLAKLRIVSPSQGMMLESLNPNLAAHRGAPDKDPERRLATLTWAGELAIPFTTGILVGIGESREDRIQALEAIAASHDTYGHVQEVIVQNFAPKADTEMRNWPACSTETLVDTLILARDILPASVHLQAPPNLTSDIAALLRSGIDDFGGVSPVTSDYVNPEMPWPSIESLRVATEQAGGSLVPRLTVYPEFVRQADTWIDPALHFAVMDRSDANGFARDDPGAVFPEKYADAVNVGTGAEVIQVGRRSTAWYSGADIHPPLLISGGSKPSASPDIAEILVAAQQGEVIDTAQITRLFTARGNDVLAIAQVADSLREKAVGDTVTFVRNRNINYTNVCTFKCTFCGFSKGPLSLNLRGNPYLLSDEEIIGRVLEAQELGATEVCLQGGIHPSFDGDYYIHVAQAVKSAAPGIHIHGFTALEVLEGSRRLGEPLVDYLRRLQQAGLKSLPGTAAEILSDDIRAEICPDKINTEEWLMVHETAHSIGLRSNVTIMFGSIERPEHWAKHIVLTRELQSRTGGFTEFVPLPFVHMASPIYLKRKARRGPTWRETVLMHSVGRIAYHGFIDNIQASWVKLGAAGAQQLLQAGVNDLGGTLMDENISRAAGATHGQGITDTEFAAVVAPLNRPLAERTTLYKTPALLSP